MRLLYFHQHFATPRGTAPIRSYTLAQRLIARGHQVTMVCGSFLGGDTGLTHDFRRGCRRGVVDGIDVIEFDLSYSNSDGYLVRALTFLRFVGRSAGVVLGERYDAIFATTTPLTAGIPGILGRWMRGKPFVFEVRDLWPELPREMGVIRNPLVLAGLSWLEWLTYHSATRLVGLSPGIVDGIAQRGIPRESIEMVPNGCDLDLLPSNAHGWRPEGVEPTDLMAVFTGTHGVANGLDAVLDAAAELKRRGRDDIKLVLVGQGQLKSHLVLRAAGEGLDNVVFHDPVGKERLAGLLAEAELGMQILANVPAFYYGTSPNKFFDYLTAGLPVLCNYPGWLAEIISAHACGFVVPPDDPSAFAQALETAADSRGVLAEMGQRSRILAEVEFDRNQLADQWVSWLEESVSGANVRWSKKMPSTNRPFPQL